MKQVLETDQREIKDRTDMTADVRYNWCCGGGALVALGEDTLDLLKFIFPQPIARTVTSPTISGY